MLEEENNAYCQIKIKLVEKVFCEVHFIAVFYTLTRYVLYLILSMFIDNLVSGRNFKIHHLTLYIYIYMSIHTHYIYIIYKYMLIY